MFSLYGPADNLDNLIVLMLQYCSAFLVPSVFSGEHLKAVKGVRFARQWDAFYRPSGIVEERFFLRRRAFLLRQNRDAPDQLSEQECRDLFARTTETNGRRALWIRWLSFHHFGHLLTETIGSLWPLLLDDGSLIDHDVDLLVPSAFKRGKGLKALVSLFPERQGRFVFAADLPEVGTSYEAVLLPRQSIINYQRISPSHLLFVRQFLQRYMRYICHLNPAPLEISQQLLDHPAIRATSLTGLKRIYLSRSRLIDKKRALVSEHSLEDALLNRGWAVLHPEQLPLNLQLTLLDHADCIAGVTGSAFHLLMGLEQTLGKKVVTLDKVSAPVNGPKDTYSLQFKCQGLDAKRLRVMQPFKDIDSGFPRLKLSDTMSSDDVSEMIDAHAR